MFTQTGGKGLHLNLKNMISTVWPLCNGSSASAGTVVAMGPFDTTFT
jgi:hypothetical protein